MATPELDIQGEWDPVPLREQWPVGLDNLFIMKRLQTLPVEETALGASGRILEVAAAEAVHSCRLASQGLTSVVVEPSPPLLDKAREHMAQFGVHLHLIRGIAETLPFRDHTFDRVLIDSALDHLAAPDTGIREMIRVLKPDGRFIVSFVNYGSLSVRLSRLCYRVERLFNPAAREEGRFWDTPVPIEHTFECTYRNVQRMCGQYLEFERAVGVSMLWNTPGWDELLRQVSRRRSEKILDTLDRVARRLPGLADFVLMVWRPRRHDDAIGLGLQTMPPLAKLTAARPELPPPRVETMRVTPADPVYQQRAVEDVAFAATWGYAPVIAQRFRDARPYANRSATGDPARSWLDDLAAHGPFARAAVFGCEEDDEVEAWVRSGASTRTDVFDPIPIMIDRLRTRLASRAHRLRIVRADLNFLVLPRDRYDVIWSGRALGRVVNLEYLFDEAALALRAGGLFAFSCYVGERRQQYAPERLARVNAALREVPERYRFGEGDVAPTPEHGLSPFTANRSGEIVDLAKARFDVVREVYMGVLFPLLVHVDVPALDRDAPEVLERLAAAEVDARRDPALRPCAAYILLRKRS